MTIPTQSMLSRQLRRALLVTVTCIGVSACLVVEQPESIRVVAAFEVPLPTQGERERFLSLIGDIAGEYGMHVDAVSDGVITQGASINSAHALTIDASVWRGEDDGDYVASVRDVAVSAGLVWIMFVRGEDPALNTEFREALMSEICSHWPGTLSLPVMPTGAIPLREDLVRTPGGYVVDPNVAHRYQLAEGQEEQQ